MGMDWSKVRSVGNLVPRGISGRNTSLLEKSSHTTHPYESGMMSKN